MKNNRPKPKEEKVCMVEIQDIAFGGNGVGRVDGKVWFVPYCLPGEIVQARAVRIRKDYVEAELLGVQQASPNRVKDPPCRYFGECGGCVYQHATYETQLAIKQKQVAELLRRVARIVEPETEPVVPCPNPLGYRNRITVHIADGRVGFHCRGGQELVDVEFCAIAAGEVNQRLSTFRAKRPFDGHRTLRSYDSPAGFRQTNDSVGELLLAHVCSNLPEEGDVLVDVFCGAGFFAKALRERFRKVIGVDWSVAAIEAANVETLPHESYLQADAGEALKEILNGQDEKEICMILDPPAEGLSEEIIEALLTGPRLKRMIYISCNPSTFSRDLRRLAAGFRLVRVTPFDMFPQTAAIEVAGILEPVTNPQ